MTGCLPYRLQKRGGTLLNQQCWLWGQDVRRAEGNLLLELGFARQRPPEGEQGCTQYTRAGAGTELRVWGFGFYFHDGYSGLYLNRYAFAPQRVTLCKAVWTAGDVPCDTAEAEHATVAAAVRAVAALEQELLHAAGLAYRARCLHGWSRRALPPAELAPAWLALASEVEAHAQRAYSRCGTGHAQNGPCSVQRPDRTL